MIRVLTVDIQAAHPIDQPGPPTLEQLYGWVGVQPGYLQMIQIQCGDKGEWCQLWVDEEGKLRGKPVNKFATVLLHGHLAKHRQPIVDYIVGDAVLLSGKHKAK